MSDLIQPETPFFSQLVPARLATGPTPALSEPPRPPVLVPPLDSPAAPVPPVPPVLTSPHSLGSRGSVVRTHGASAKSAHESQAPMIRSQASAIAGFVLGRKLSSTTLLGGAGSAG
jgi:hypothetical protein